MGPKSRRSGWFLRFPILVVLLAACSNSGPSTLRSKETGLTITSQGKIRGFRAQRTSGPEATAGTQHVGDAISIEAKSADFPVSLVFPIPPGDSPDDLLVVWRDGNEWVPAGGEIDLSSSTITVQTDHLSVWSVDRWPGWSIVREMSTALRRAAGIGRLADSPCQGSIESDASVSPSTDQLYVCAEPIQGGGFRVRMSNPGVLTWQIPADGIPGFRLIDSSYPSMSEFYVNVVSGLEKSSGLGNSVNLHSGGSLEFTTTGPFSASLSINNGSWAIDGMLFVIGVTPKEMLSKSFAKGFQKGNSFRGWFDAVKDTRNGEEVAAMKKPVSDILDEQLRTMKVSVTKSASEKMKAFLLDDGVKTFRGIAPSLDFAQYQLAVGQIPPRETAPDSQVATQGNSLTIGSKVSGECFFGPTQPQPTNDGYQVQMYCFFGSGNERLTIIVGHGPMPEVFPDEKVFVEGTLLNSINVAGQDSLLVDAVTFTPK